MKNYFIPNLAGGVVDEAIKGKLSPDYKTKATKLTNAWIKPNNSVATRPGLEAPDSIKSLPGILDVKYTKDRIIVLREVELGPLGNLKEYLRENNLDSFDLSAEDNRAAFDTQLRESPLFNTLLNYKQALDDSGMRVDIVETSMVEVADSDDGTSGNPLNPADPRRVHLGFNATATIERTSELVIDKLLLILSYDRATNERINSECYAISRSKENVDEKFTQLAVTDNASTAFSPTEFGYAARAAAPELDPYLVPDALQATSNISGLTDFILNNVPENENELATLRPTRVPGAFSLPTQAEYDTIAEALVPQLSYFLSPDTPTNTRVAGNYSEREYVTVYEDIFNSSIAKQAQYSGGGDNTFIIEYQLPDTFITKYFNDIDSGEADVGISSSEVLDIERRLGSSLGRSLFNSSELPSSLYDRADGVGFALAGLRNIITKRGLLSDHTGGNRTARAALDERAINTFAAKTIDRDASKLPILVTRMTSPLGSTQPTKTILPLDDYIEANPRLRSILSRIKFSLSAVPNQSLTSVNVLPDISIVLPGSDIPATGTYLLSLDDDTHIFCAEHSGLYTRGILDTSDNETFAEGVGPAVKDYGVTLYVQKYNKMENDEPKFFPFPSRLNNPTTDRVDSAKASDYAETIEVIYMTLDLDSQEVFNIMDELQLISFYASDGAKGLVNSVLFQVGGRSIDRNLVAGSTFRQALEDSDLIRRLQLEGTVRENALNPIFSIERLSEFSYTYLSSENFALSGSDLPTRLNFDTDGRALLRTNSVNIPDSVTYPSLATLNVTGEALTVAQLQAAADTLLDTYTLRVGRNPSLDRGRVYDIIKNGAVVTSGTLDQLRGRGLVRSITADTDGRTGLRSNWRIHFYTRLDDTYVVDGTTLHRGQIEEQLEAAIAREAAGLSTIVSQVYRSSTQFVTYQPATDKYFSGEDRNVILSGEKVNFSAPNDKSIFSVGFADFINNNIHAYANRPYLIASGLLDYVLRDFSLEGLFQTRDLSRVPAEFTLDGAETTFYGDTERGGVLVSDKGMYSVSFTDSGVILRRQLTEGLDTNAITQSSMVLGGSGASLKLNRFYEEAGGYTSDLLNDELSLPEIGNLASLFNRHQLILASFNTNDSNRLLAISFNKQRAFKGFSFLEFRGIIKGIVPINDDKIGVIFEDGYGELDFSKEGSKDYGETAYKYTVRTMPILNVNEEDFSVTDTVSIHSAVLGFNGSPKFKYRIIDALTGESVEGIFNKHDPADASDEEYTFSGQLWVNNFDANGGYLLELEIEKEDGQHMEINSINLMMGK